MAIHTCIRAQDWLDAGQATWQYHIEPSVCATASTADSLPPLSSKDGLETPIPELQGRRRRRVETRSHHFFNFALHEGLHTDSHESADHSQYVRVTCR